MNKTIVFTIGSGTLWSLANISYAGMRAQGQDKTWGWRKIAFVWGFPSTFITYLFVEYGGKRAYGIDLPTKD